MSQIDFGKAFAEKNAPIKPVTGQNGNPAQHAFVDPTNIDAPKPPSIWRTAHFQRADWANILFVFVAVAGSIFCAFYFYNGAEVLRTAVGWPKEMLYPRPPDRMNDVATADATDPFIPRASAAGNSRGFDQGARPNNVPAQFNPSSGANPTNTGAAPSLASLSRGSAVPSLPGNPSGSGPVPSVPGLPGTEALGQAVNSARTSLQRATRLLNGPHTVVIVKNHVTRATHRTVSAAEKTGGVAAKGLASIASAQRQSASVGSVSRLAQNTKASMGAASANYRAALTNIGHSSVIGSSRSLGGRESLGGGLERSAGLGGLGRSAGLSGVGRNAGMSGLGDLAGRAGGMGEGIGRLGRGRGRER
jgi:hypothetical protein